MKQDFYIFLLYLFYGGAFFAIGVSITSRDTRLSNLEIARYLWIFALFAYIHAFHEWYELFLRIHASPMPDDLFLPASLVRLSMVMVSFCLLLLFSVSILGIGKPDRWFLLALAYITLVGVMLILLLSSGGNLTSEFFAWADFRIRNLIGLPGAILSGLGFILYSRTVRNVSRKGAFNFSGAGVSLIIYGLFTGAIPSGTVLPVAGLPVEFFRGLCAVLILHFVMHALHTFDEEMKATIEDRLNRFVQSEKLSALGKLAAGIAHEINNPLANVSLNLEMLKKDLQKDEMAERQMKKVDAAERNLERASQIARELLHISSERESEFERTPLEDITGTVLNLLGPRRKEYRFTVDMNGAGFVQAVPWKLEEVFLNIIINAMDATRPGGKISVKGYKRNGNTIVEISDDGAGISPQDLDRVFEPFFTTKEVGRGTGLGLSICYGIMQVHRGDIRIKSEPGYGTTVSLIFPEGIEDHDQASGS